MKRQNSSKGRKAARTVPVAGAPVLPPLPPDHRKGRSLTPQLVLGGVLVVVVVAAAVIVFKPSWPKSGPAPAPGGGASVVATATEKPSLPATGSASATTSAEASAGTGAGKGGGATAGSGSRSSSASSGGSSAGSGLSSSASGGWSPDTPADPSVARVDAALAWLRTRRGSVAVAVTNSNGHTTGYRRNERFTSPDVVKAMLLVAYLREHPSADASHRRTLSSMVGGSDGAAAAIFGEAGADGLRSLAEAATMRDFSVGGGWNTAGLTPSDQARFFYKMDGLIPSSDVSFVRRLLSEAGSARTWGIPGIAKPAGWTTYVAGGKRTVGGSVQVHQVARLERHGEKFAVAIMTADQPSAAYGVDTVRGVMSRLLGR